jgi:hypothetical protein
VGPAVADRHGADRVLLGWSPFVPLTRRLPRPGHRRFGEAGFEVGDHLRQQAGVLQPDRLRADRVDAGDLGDALVGGLGHRGEPPHAIERGLRAHSISASVGVNASQLPRRHHPGEP